VQELVGQQGAGFDQMLAVIQHQQQRLAAQVVCDYRRQRAARQLAQVERGGERGHEVSRIGEGRQLDQPCAIGKIRQRLGGDL